MEKDWTKITNILWALNTWCPGPAGLKSRISILFLWSFVFYFQPLRLWFCQWFAYHFWRLYPHVKESWQEKRLFVYWIEKLYLSVYSIIFNYGLNKIWGAASENNVDLPLSYVSDHMLNGVTSTILSSSQSVNTVKHFVCPVQWGNKVQWRTLGYMTKVVFSKTSCFFLFYIAIV